MKQETRRNIQGVIIETERRVKVLCCMRGLLILKLSKICMRGFQLVRGRNMRI